MQGNRLSDVVAIVASGSVFDERIRPFFSRRSLRVKRAKSGPEGLRLCREAVPDLLVTQYPLAGLASGEFFEHLYRPELALADLPLLVLTRQDHLQEVEERLGGRKARACCMESAEDERFHRALYELVDVAARCDSRVLVTADVDLAEGTVRRVIQTLNLSESGAFLRMGTPLPAGAVVPFSVQLPGAQLDIRGVGEVVRHSDPELDEAAGIGFRFLDLEAGGRERLASFVTSLGRGQRP